MPLGQSLDHPEESSSKIAFQLTTSPPTNTYSNSLLNQGEFDNLLMLGCNQFSHNSITRNSKDGDVPLWSQSSPCQQQHDTLRHGWIKFSIFITVIHLDVSRRQYTEHPDTVKKLVTLTNGASLYYSCKYHKVVLGVAVS